MLPRILMIDDSLSLHTLVSHFMKAAGYDFVSAYDGESGIDSAIRQQPGLILLDMDMPGIDGLETCRRLMNEQETKSVPTDLQRFL